MSVSGRKMPSERSLLTVLDEHARATVKRAQQDVAPIVSRETPRRSGTTAAALKPRVSRTATGAALTVSPGRNRPHGNVTVAQLVRWLTRGTGLRREGPGVKRRIRSSQRPPRPMVLPGGRRVWSTAGQHPNPFMARIKAAATLRVERAAREGAADAARAVARKVTG